MRSKCGSREWPRHRLASGTSKNSATTSVSYQLKLNRRPIKRLSRKRQQRFNDSANLSDDTSKSPEPERDRTLILALRAREAPRSQASPQPPTPSPQSPAPSPQSTMPPASCAPLSPSAPALRNSPLS